MSAFPTAFPLEGTTPLISDRFIVTMVAGASITIGQLLYLGTDGRVYPTTSANLLTIIGIAMTNQSTIGNKVSVVARGIVRATAYGAITAADQLTSASGGSAGLIQTDNVSKNTTVIGMALQSIASGATGAIILW
jgi:hypothetical protein